MAMLVVSIQCTPGLVHEEGKAFPYQLNLSQKSVDLVPALEDALLFLGEVNRHG